jgi:sulfoxide reductase heme-binding subunit YedZ
MKIIHTTGDWALNFLVLALALRAFKRNPSTVGVNVLHGVSGFFAFYYVSLHFSSYVVLDQLFNFSAILEDVSRHRRIIAGFAGFLVLGTVAGSSLKGVIAKIGFRRWKRIHGFTYLVPVCGVVHYLWLVKKDIRIPLVYTVIVVSLIGYKQFRRLLGAFFKQGE